MYMHDKNIALYTYNDIIIICYRHTHTGFFFPSVFSVIIILSEALGLCAAEHPVQLARHPFHKY